jgi:hypothetical protein
VSRPPAAFELEAFLGRLGERLIATLPPSRVHHFAIADELKVGAGRAMVAELGVDLLMELSQPPEALARG